MKKLLCILMSALMFLSLFACEETGLEGAISGTEFDPDEYNPETIERYEHRNYGIILEYPSGFEKVGNFELDGYMTFEKEGTSIFVYVPDYDNQDVLFVEEYVENVLELEGEDGSGIARYGKSNGYKIIQNIDDKVRIDFVIKGIDAFYRFAYMTNAEGFTEENETFMQVMSSIRIDDGVYSKLTSMASRYRILLEYAKSMQYITDMNYVNHSLNNYETTGEEHHKNLALNTCETVKTEILEICNYERAEGDAYDKEWEKVKREAEEVVECCDKIKAAINTGKISDAQKIARTEINYDLSDAALGYLSIIDAEIAEY